MTMLDDRQAALERENAELRRQLDLCRAELEEARAQQTATAEVLQVINSSPGDLAPVFDAMLEKALWLCAASSGMLLTADGDYLNTVALRNVPGRLAEYMTRQPISPDPASTLGQVIRERRVIQTVDNTVSEPYRHRVPHAVAAVELGGARTILHVPLVKDDRVSGDFIIFRQEVRPFSDKQIALVQNFAAQAVIAMENARLLTETREALEQQTATADVLQVINSSPGNLAPVFDAILEKAHNLCGVAIGSLQLYENGLYRAVATRGVTGPLADWLRHGYRPGPSNPIRQLAEGAPFVHITDLAEIDDPAARRAVEFGGTRTLLWVALHKENTLLGMIVSARLEVLPFSEKEIALLQNFAAQAVIAMENARLITETREALEQQTATAEVLQVINSSPGDLAPVFDAMLVKATTLCDAAHGNIWTYDGELFHPVATHGNPRFAEWLRQRGPVAPGSGAILGRIAQGEDLVEIADSLSDVSYRTSAHSREVIEITGARTALAVPLRKDNTLLGAIFAYRQEVRPFSDKQIALLKNFAAQAVIAMENARLLTETREALEQQTATTEVLQVINSSPGDLGPVFDAMLERAVRLCEFDFSSLWTFDGTAFHPVARHEVPERFWQYLQDHTPPPFARLLAGEHLVHIPDVQSVPALMQSDFGRGLLALGIEPPHSLLIMSLRKDDALLGVIVAYRHEVRPFSDKQIALLQNFAAQAVIAMENARLITETREALEQQTATAEVVQVINSSPGDLAPVFDAMLERATSLCEADIGILFTHREGSFTAAAWHGTPVPLREFLTREPLRPSSDTGLGRMAIERRLIHLTDVAERDSYRRGDPLSVASVELGGVRTFIAVPLVGDDALVGAFVLYRQEVRSFSGKQIALLQNFAAQAVIAMENARLLTETREALEQQTATTEVLQVINSSPGDLAPVFGAILEKAHALCGADHGHLTVYEDGQFRALATHGVPEAFATLLRQPFRPGLDVARRLRAGESVIQFTDMATLSYDPDDQIGRGAAELAGARTLLIVALRKDKALLGYITAHRIEVRPFSAKEIALLQNFAAQAVIAVENARLLTETREALAQQTATAEVLQVINSSPGDLAPVFDAMLQKALSLCGAAFGQLVTFDGAVFRAAAWRGYEPGPGATVPMPGMALHQLVHGAEIVHIPDITADDVYRSGNAVRRRLADEFGGRTAIWVALRKDAALRGAFVIYRTAVRPFSDREISLLQNFAAQAVIAMENARLITETREALEQQTATAEVLQVINSSPGDLAPVFEAMLEKATRLCDASLGTLWAYDGERIRPLAMRGASREYAEYLSREPLRPGAGALGSFVRGETILHVVDLKDTEAYRNGDKHRRALVDLGGGRSLLGVPLRTDDQLRGAFLIYRREPQPFSDKQIALLQNFAAQAVIAMENARLITETRQALEQQTATAEVLRVINSSPGDLAPVFEAILEKAQALCETSFGALMTYDGERFRSVTQRRVPAQFKEIIEEGIRPRPRDPFGRVVEGAPFSHIHDLAEVAAQYPSDPLPRAAVDLGGIRTFLLVPLRKDDALLGVITAYRQEVRPFTDKQIALLQNFAAQAVIAIENARLLTETREALEQQTATAEVLQVINASPGDLAPVFDAMLDKALGSCGAAFGALWTYDGERVHAAAVCGAPPAFEEFLTRAPHSVGPDNAHGRLLRGELVVHIADVTQDEAYRSGDPVRRTLVEFGGGRTLLAVPLRKDDAFLGDFVIYRREVRPFSSRQIALLQSFAAQAVIAMENARLLDELRQRTRDLQESLEYQTAISEVLRVISGSVFDLEPVLQTVVSTAIRLCRADQAVIYRNTGGEYHWAAGWSLAPEYESIERTIRIKPGAGTLVGRAALERRTVHILDAWTDPLYEAKADARVGGVHTMLGVPLLRDGEPIGVIGLARRRIEAYTEKEIGLVTTFGDQAVIAIQNARLLNELRERTDELGQQQAVLRVTFDNMADGVVRFDEELRLAAWNRNFVEILGLPDWFLAQPRTYADYVRHLIERGEFDAVDPEVELRRLDENANSHWTAERTRPDGRVIEVRHNPVPGGGFVQIYSDITERKRAEADIRAARDAAEAALHDLQAAQVSLVHAQKMAALGQLTAGIAHEIKNPLNFVNNFAGLSVELLDELKETAAPGFAALGNETRAEAEEIVAMLTGNLEKITEHGRRADGIVRSMLDHSRGGGSERRPVDINTLIDEALNLAYHGARAQDQDFNVALDRNFEPDIAPIEVAPQDLTRVFLNLFGNGFYAADQRRRQMADPAFHPLLKVTIRDLGAEVEIRVRDNGTGIAPEIRDKLFQPFFTTKPTGEGTGLGLSISYDIVTQQHGGTITVDSRFGEFTEFTIRLPRRDGSVAG